MIDLNQFCANEYELRTHLQKPWRSAEGIVRSNGAILVCVPDDGGDYPEPVADMVTTVEKFLHDWPGVNDPISLQSLKIPPLRICHSCHGEGHVWSQRCNECDGEGEFEHGTHIYDCAACDDGRIVKERHDDCEIGMDAQPMPCRDCGGAGEFFQSIRLCNADFDRRYLAMIAALPDAKIWPNGSMSGAYFTFDGGHGWLMPRRK